METTNKSPFANTLRPGPICLAFLLIYVITASPSIGWRDGPEFSSATNSLGVPHPAGFPTFSVLTKIMTFLPLGSIPFRITLGVALFAVGALWILYILVLRWSSVDYFSKHVSTYSGWAAAGTMVAFGVTSTLWVNTTENEVYTLHLLFIALILYCTVRWSSGEGEKWLYLGAFIYGIAAGNHATVALYLPGFLAFFFIRGGADHWRKFLHVFFFFLVGFSVYLYIPIRSATNPPIDLGNPDTWQRFLMHVTDRKDGPSHFIGVREGHKFFDHLVAFSRTAAPWWFWPFLLPLAIIGLWRTKKRDKLLASLFVYIISINTLFFLTWVTLSNFLPTYFLVAYLSGVGMTYILCASQFLLTSPKFRVALFSIILVCLFLGGAITGYRNYNRSGNYLSYEIFRTSFETLPPDSITIVTALWPYHVVFQDIYRMRNDITVILQSDFVAPEYFNPITQDRFPRIKIPQVAHKSANLTVDFQKFVNENIGMGFNIYCEPGNYSNELYRNLIPTSGFLMQLRQEPVGALDNEFVQKIFDHIKKDLLENIQTRQLFDEPWIGPYYLRYFFFLAEYLRDNGRYSDSITIYKMTIELLGPDGLNSISLNDTGVVYNEWAKALSALNRLDEAVAKAQRAIELLPRDPGILYNMGLFLYRKGEMSRAEVFFKKSLAIEESDLAWFFLGNVKESFGQLDEAAQFYTNAKDITNSTDFRKTIENKIETLRGNNNQ